MSNSSTDQFAAVRDQASHLLQSIIEQATARALNQTQKQGRVASVRSKVPFQRKSNPTARDLAMNAAAGALELWQAASERAGGPIGSAQSSVVDSANAIRGSVSDRASSVQSTVSDSAHAIRDTASTVQSSVSGTAQSIKGTVGDTASAVGSGVTGAARSAGDASKAAVSTTAQGGKNTVGLVFWTGAAAAIVYYAFLDEELKAKVREVANSALVQAREMLADFQGQDGQFPPPTTV
jgi:hypothetical protein